MLPWTTMSTTPAPSTVDFSKLETRLFINGEFVNSVSEKTFDTVDPATEKVICSVQEADAADVDKAVRIISRWCVCRY